MKSQTLKFLVLLAAASMPLIAWLAQRQVFGPDNATLSARFPTLIVAAGYAFAIWGLIFALDLAFGLWQVSRRRADHGSVDRIRALASAGFLLTAAWMVIFPQQQFWLALVVIWAALTALAVATIKLARSPLTAAEFCFALLPLALHTGWLSLAAFLNTAQVVVAYELLSTTRMLPWSLALWAAAAGLLLWLNSRLRLANVAFALAALWGLAGVVVKQSQSQLAGAHASAWVAAALGVVLLVQTAYLQIRRYRASAPKRTAAA